MVVKTLVKAILAALWSAPILGGNLFYLASPRGESVVEKQIAQGYGPRCQITSHGFGLTWTNFVKM